MDTFNYAQFVELHKSSLLHLQTKYDIKDMPALLGQIKHESGDFKKMVENLNYTVVALLTKFKRHRISVDDAHKYGRVETVVKGKKVITQKANQKEIANHLYGGQWGLVNLGNVNHGDGWKYRGRTWLMCTGKANYKSFGDFMGINFVDNPDKIIEYNWDFIGWFWMKNKLNEKDDIASLTIAINGGVFGIKDRFDYQEKFRAVWND